MAKTFTCAMCGGIFDQVTSDEDVRAEAIAIFGKPPEEWNGGQDVVCDDCFHRIDPATHPKELKETQRNI